MASTTSDPDRLPKPAMDNVVHLLAFGLVEQRHRHSTRPTQRREGCEHVYGPTAAVDQIESDGPWNGVRIELQLPQLVMHPVAISGHHEFGPPSFAFELLP